MTDAQVAELLVLLTIYVMEYGGPDADKGEINPHTMTLAELYRDLQDSLDK